MEKSKYTIDEFVLNDSFQRYTLQPTLEDAEYWSNWTRENPDAAETVEKSKEIILFIHSHKVLPKHQDLSDEVFTKLQLQIESEQNQVMRYSRNSRMRYFGYAASVIVLLGLAFLIRYAVKPADSYALGKFLEVIVPEGQRTQMVLPDGTKVWLNSGSRFKYPTEFLRNNRDVYIEGEAFFDVSHNKSKPFIVHTRENLMVKVLGTQFNVKCYSSDKTIETTLVTGSITLIKAGNENQIIQELNLKPNEKATYEVVNKNVSITSLSSAAPVERVENDIAPVKKRSAQNEENEMEVITAWKDDALVFHDETFEEISIKMERWFGLKIIIKDEELKSERFTGKFVNKETIYQILDIFDRSEAIRYSTNNKEITIRKK